MSQLPIARQRLLGFSGALVIGIVGGALFAWLHMPLAWMLGPMFACTLAALLRIPIQPLDQVRAPMTAVIGVLLGVGFTPDLLAGVASWVPSLIGLALFLLICAVVGTFYFRVVGGFDLQTAFFAAMPGGLVEMMTLGQDRGGDVTLIALVHSARILLVVTLLPSMLLWMSGATAMPAPVIRPSILQTEPATLLWLLACALAGMLLGRVLRLPAQYLLGPMIVSAIVHFSGASDFRLPNEIILVAQLFLGTLVGCRFSGISPKLVLRVLGLSVGSVAMLLIFAAIAALVLSHLTDLEIPAVLLAFSPGGLTEMSLVALSLQVEVAFVSGHHVARILMVLGLASTLFGLAQRLTRRAK